MIPEEFRSPNKARILLVIDGIEFGGGERVSLQIASGLKMQNQFFVTTMPGGQFEQAIREAGIQSFPIDMHWQFALKAVHQICRIIKINNIDIVHSQGSRADFFARIAGRIAGIRHNICSVAAPVETFDIGPLRKTIYRLVDSLTEKHVDRFIVVSDALKQFMLSERGISAHRVVRIYNGVELHKYHRSYGQSKLRTEFGIPQDVPLIGSIGRIVPLKGIEYLIQAARDILISKPETRFLLVGEGPLKNKLIDQCKIWGIKKNIIFPGFMNDVREALSAIDLFVFPSLVEGFPMVTLEAMAMEKPIVATRIDGITEQITNGVEGILVPPKDPVALAAAINKIIENKELARSLGSAARKRVVREFGVDKMISETEKVYHSLLD